MAGRVGRPGSGDRVGTGARPCRSVGAGDPVGAARPCPKVGSKTATGSLRCLGDGVFGLGGAWFAAQSEVRYGSHENYAN
ncbi:hypothetical protein Asera_11630 [Actinocatenispora sera]|uniref:Uncharacterized protein n=1 Tax=Actinocatenispora sera TaxID=390989 RepID=A0A810KWK8_9ACTN|nr:hypothetical protein Asera_11630 [Actinocatenispora sera]